MITCYVVFELNDPYELPIAICSSFRDIDRTLRLGHDTARKAFIASPYRTFFTIGKFGVEVAKIPKE